MKNKFVANGFRRFMRAKRNVASPEAIEAKFAAELANASPADKTEIQKRIAQELLKRENTANHQPSAGTLW
jgi:hypothetical protein